MSVIMETFDPEAVIDRACRSKKRYESVAHAAHDAAVLRARGERVFQYRCPFGDGTRAHAHFHVGHVPSLERLEDIARAIRERQR